MKHIIKVFIGLIILTSCSESNEKVQEEINLEWTKYNNAMTVNDFQVARSVVYNIIALDSNNHSYYDTLAKLYYATKNIESASKCAAKGLAFSVSEPTLEIAYNCAKALKKNEDVLIYGEELLTFNEDSIALMYELAFSSLQMNDLVYSEALLNKIIILPGSLTEQYAEYRGNGVQKVVYRAAAYNLLGFVFNERLDKENAQSMFSGALLVQKDYVLAQENFNALTAELAATDSTSHSSQ